MLNKMISLAVVSLLSSILFTGCASVEVQDTPENITIESTKEQPNNEESKQSNQVIIDNEYCKVTIENTFIRNVEYWTEDGSEWVTETGLIVKIENKTDKDIYSFTDGVSFKNEMISFTTYANDIVIRPECSAKEEWVLYNDIEGKPCNVPLNELSNLKFKLSINDDATMESLTECDVTIK